MAPRYKVTGEVTDDSATYRLEDLDSGGFAGTLELGELTACVKMRDADGKEVARQVVSLGGTDPLALQKALRRFLAEARPGEEYDFDEVPKEGGAVELMLSGEFYLDDEEEGEDDEEDEEE